MHNIYGLKISSEAFPIFLVVGWLVVTTCFSFFSGWHKLMKIYPDVRSLDSSPLQTYKRQSGSMGFGVSMSRMLTFVVFKNGLRLKINRLFGPFNTPLFIPWSEIKTMRNQTFAGGTVMLTFGGGGPFSRLEIESDLADKLWPDAGVVWSLSGAISERPTKKSIKSLIFKQWIITSALAATFFIIAGYSSILFSILFPAIVFGMISIVRYRYKG